MHTPYTVDVGILLLMKGKLTIVKVKSSHCRSFVFNLHPLWISRWRWR